VNNFQIAIHLREDSFSDRWIEYCEEKGVSYKIVDCYKSDIISQLASANAFLWHWNHTSPKDVLIARHVIRAAELIGQIVYPNTATCWSFDDKVAQKYILEAVGAPLVPSYVFFDQDSAMNWVDRASFPKVFKLRRGSGSRNVRLIRSCREARAIVKQAFGRGFKPIGRVVSEIVTRIAKSTYEQQREKLGKIVQFPQRLLRIHQINQKMGRECGYVYFQDFIPANQFDTRITVIGDRYAFGFTRNVRKNDFRASGSGSVEYNKDRIDLKCIKIAFDVSKKLNTQSIALDFVINPTGEPLIVEVSYCFVGSAVYHCPGYWDNRLQWHEGNMWPQDAILADLIEQLRQLPEKGVLG